MLGVDDFAVRRNVYGTVLVDIQTRRPVDLLPERSAKSFRGWLDAHPSRCRPLQQPVQGAGPGLLGSADARAATEKLRAASGSSMKAITIPS